MTRRRASVAFVAAVLVLAGCSGGGGLEPARVEVVAVTVGPISTELTFRLFTESREEMSLHASAFNEASPLTSDIRDVAIEEGALDRRHLPLLGTREGVKPADFSFCICSDSPKTIDADGVLLSATYPALDPATTAVTVDVPGFEPLDVPEDEGMIYRLAASSDYPDRSARGAIAQLMTFGAFAPDESGGVSRVERDGELAMWRWDMTYDAGEYHMVAWALTEEEFTVLVTLTGRGGLDPAMVERMQDSIAIASESP
ncbi:MAG: hypothetical protein ACTMIR_07070 [Cellulomonadaceae bacterium]